MAVYNITQITFQLQEDDQIRGTATGGVFDGSVISATGVSIPKLARTASAKGLTWKVTAFAATAVAPAPPLPPNHVKKMKGTEHTPGSANAKFQKI